MTSSFCFGTFMLSFLLLPFPSVSFQPWALLWKETVVGWFPMYIWAQIAPVFFEFTSGSLNLSAIREVTSLSISAAVLK